MSQVIAAVKALILHEGKFLFLHEPTHHGDIWDLPGGKIEYGEEPESALIREVKEEVYLDVTIERLAGIWWFYSKNSQRQVICTTYLCHPSNGTQIDFSHNPSTEHFTDYIWLSPAEALVSEKVDLSPSLKTLLSSL